MTGISRIQNNKVLVRGLNKVPVMVSQFSLGRRVHGACELNFIWFLNW